MMVIFLCLIVATFELLNHPGEFRTTHHPSSQSWWILRETNCASFPFDISISCQCTRCARAGNTLTPRVRASTLPMAMVSYQVLKKRRWDYLCLARMKRQILASWSMYLIRLCSLRMGIKLPLSVSASKPIRQGVAAAQQLMVTILKSSTASKGILSRTYSMPSFM